jgi:predicted SnoaL-like aldol condensation-catalyzing enzyme
LRVLHIGMLRYGSYFTGTKQGTCPRSIDVLFNRRDYATAERYWSDRYIQHSAHIELGHDGLFNQIRSLPDTLRYENRLILAEGEYVITHGRFSGSGREAAWIAVDIVRFEDGKLAEHWDVLQDEATKAQSKSGLRCSAIASRIDLPPSLDEARS